MDMVRLGPENCSMVTHSLAQSIYTLYSFKKPALALAALLAQACAKFSTGMGPELEEGGERKHLVVQRCFQTSS